MFQMGKKWIPLFRIGKRIANNVFGSSSLQSGDILESDVNSLEHLVSSCLLEGLLRSHSENQFFCDRCLPWKRKTLMFSFRNAEENFLVFFPAELNLSHLLHLLRQSRALHNNSGRGRTRQNRKKRASCHFWFQFSCSTLHCGDNA